jgi:hypothetical protein
MVSETETRCMTQVKTITVYNVFVLKRNCDDRYTLNNNTETDILKNIYIIMVGVNWLRLGSSSGLL